MSIFVGITSIISSLTIVILAIVKPYLLIKNKRINLYWIIAIIGALVILLSGALSFSEWWASLIRTDSINPLQILILFLSMSAISIFLDEVGFFSHLASWTLKHVKKSQISLFIILYVFVSLLTMFTSNDIIILTLTPFILFFCKEAKISPIPYLVEEFIAANTWSMIFIIGNPTNIYLASSFNISFFDYFKVMAVPTILTGLTEFIILFLLFKNKLKDELHPQEIPLEKIDLTLTVIGLTILGICTILLVISSYIKLPMYLISFVSFILLTIFALIYYLIKKEKPTHICATLKRAPYEIIPFILGMFTMVLALEKYGITANISAFFGDNAPTFIYGFASALSSNLFNNIPMSVLYSSICSFTSEAIKLKAIYSSIIGSNIGAFISPLGALAGIMWLNILKKENIKFTYIDFIKYGLIVALPSLLVALSSLLIFI